MVRLVTNEYNEQVWTNWADYYRNNDYHMEEIGYVINK